MYLPGTTPSYSNAGFQILAYALEGITCKKFEDVLSDSILKPLNMNQTSLSTAPASNLGVIPGNSTASGWGTSYGEGPALSMYSNLRDIAAAGTSILSSRFLSSAKTRRWLKPISSTSNPANIQGRPWEVYNAVGYENAPVTEIYTIIGSIGHYSSYIGLVPKYGVGFVVLAVDSETTADLNAYVDFISIAVQPALEKTAIAQANASYSGTYTSKNGTSNLTMSIEVDGKPGLVVTALTNNGIDVRAAIAKLKGIIPDALIFRLYPTNFQSNGKLELRAFWQDNNDLADAGTPTCVSWMDVEDLVYGGESLDRYVFELDASGKAKAVEIPALRMVLGKLNARLDQVTIKSKFKLISTLTVVRKSRITFQCIDPSRTLKVDNNECRLLCPRQATPPSALKPAHQNVKRHVSSKMSDNSIVCIFFNVSYLHSRASSPAPSLPVSYSKVSSLSPRSSIVSDPRSYLCRSKLVTPKLFKLSRLEGIKSDSYNGSCSGCTLVL